MEMDLFFVYNIDVLLVWLCLGIAIYYLNKIIGFQCVWSSSVGHSLQMAFRNVPRNISGDVSAAPEITEQRNKSYGKRGLGHFLANL